MSKILNLNLGLLIAIITTISTLISALVTVIVTKLFENYQNSKKHHRIIIEKVIDAKLEACKSAIIYYGTYLNYLYSAKYAFEGLESHEYSILLSEGQKFNEELLKKIQLDNNNEHQKILLFYDLFGLRDEQVAEKLVLCIKQYMDYISLNMKNSNADLQIEANLRTELIAAFSTAITYFKDKISVVRNDLNEMLT